MSGLTQPAQKAPGTDLEEAEFALSEMRTQEVAMVDAAANLRSVLTMKNKDGMPAPTKKQDAPPAAAPPAAAPAAKQELTLTTAARDTMVAGLTDSLEKLTGLAQAVGEAAIDEAAPPSPEVGELLKQCAALLLSLAGDTAPAAEPAAAPAAAPVAAAAPAAPAAKVAEPTEKAGKKISSANLKKIKDAMGALKAVLDAAEPEAASTKKAEGEVDADPDELHRTKVHKMLEGFGERMDKSDSDQAKRDELIAKALQDKDAHIAAGKAAITKAKAQIAELAKRANSPGGGNAGSSEGDGGEPVAKSKVNSWGDFDRRANLIGHEPPQEAAGR